MRIITGKYKGRHFDIPRTFKARPTTDFAKENIFNVLNGYVDFEESRALDLFAGTGSISLELLSRGCPQVVSVELDRDHARFIQQCIQKIGGLEQTHSLIRGDVFRYIKSFKPVAQPMPPALEGTGGGSRFDLIFADPPYQLPELATIPDLIFEHGLLAPDGLLVFEHGAKNDFSGHPHFLEHRAYGSVNFSLFR